mmetsp:Transcript_22928/g.40805  ORF Transcript_22928/g.40805 Transcript_22928/m.40805 type:complete len:223 (+) Transcript_22928:124-792(+)
MSLHQPRCFAENVLPRLQQSLNAAHVHGTTKLRCNVKRGIKLLIVIELYPRHVHQLPHLLLPPQHGVLLLANAHVSAHARGEQMHGAWLVAVVLIVCHATCLWIGQISPNARNTKNLIIWCDVAIARAKRPAEVRIRSLLCFTVIAAKQSAGVPFHKGPGGLSKGVGLGEATVAVSHTLRSAQSVRVGDLKVGQCFGHNVGLPSRLRVQVGVHSLGDTVQQD